MPPTCELDPTRSPIHVGAFIIDISSSPEPDPEPEHGQTQAHYSRLFEEPSNLGPATRTSDSSSIQVLPRNQDRPEVDLDSKSQGSALLGSSSSYSLDVKEHDVALESSHVAEPTEKRKLDCISNQATSSTAKKCFPSPPNPFNHSISITKEQGSPVLPETQRRFSKRLLQRSISITELGEEQLPVVSDRSIIQRRPSRSHRPPGPYGFTDNQTDERLLEILFPTQYSLFQTIQHVLEYALFDFAKKWIPRLLQDNKWEIPEAGELNRWNAELGAYAFNLPKDALHPRSRTNFTRLRELLCRLYHVRHAAVHRLRGPFEGVMTAITEAGEVVFCLQDLHRCHKLNEMRNALEARNWEGLEEAIKLDTTIVSENSIQKLEIQYSVRTSLDLPLTRPIQPLKTSNFGMIPKDYSVSRTIQNTATVEQPEATRSAPVSIRSVLSLKAPERFSFSPFTQLGGQMLSFPNAFAHIPGLKFSPLNLNLAVEANSPEQFMEPTITANALQSTQAYSFGQPSLLGNMRQPLEDRTNMVRTTVEGLQRRSSNTFVDLTADGSDEIPRVKRLKVRKPSKQEIMIDLTGDSD